jgi:hypothetical protein
MGPSTGRSSTSCRASRADGGPAGARLGPSGPGPAGGRPMPGWRARMRDRECGHPAPLQSTKARYQVLPRAPVSVASSSPDLAVLVVAIRMPIGVEHECVAARATTHRRGYPHRRWNCLRRCSGPPTSAWRDGSASSWRCPLAPSGSTGAPAGADPQTRHRRRAAFRGHRDGPRDRTAALVSRPLSLVVHLGSETAVTDWALARCRWWWRPS